MSDRMLEGRTALVTGGGRGIGAAVARGLAAAGAQVAVAGRNQEAVAGVVAEITGAGGRAFPVRLDVTRPDEVAGAVEEVHRVAGPLTILVGNAGIARSAKLQDTDEAMWAEVLDTNLTGAYRVTRAFYADVLAAKKAGRILYIASVAARIGFQYTTAYCASKHGLLGLARALAHEIGPRGPTVNCVCPGWVDTDMVAQAVDKIVALTGRTPEVARQELERMNPQRRLMTADEVAAVTLFLASDAAAGVTGQGWNVDGGLVMS